MSLHPKRRLPHSRIIAKLYLPIKNVYERAGSMLREKCYKNVTVNTVLDKTIWGFCEVKQNL